MTTRKVEAFGNGARYIRAGGWAAAVTWLVDFTVFALGVVLGIAALAALDLSLDLGGGTIALAAIAWVFAVPLLYGLCYGDGRALGALIAGTRLVRLGDGGRIGAKGPWAMLVRTILLPAVIIAVVAGGGYADGTVKRVSIDVARTRRLHAEAQLPHR